jgi:predicted unusual protein kinase regulating ubiquinone biosynthesis (AarF/ABC1/UbiB family)
MKRLIHVSTFCLILTLANGAFLPLPFISQESPKRQSSSFKFKAVVTTSSSSSSKELETYETDASLLFSRTAEITGVALDLAVPFLTSMLSRSFQNASKKEQEWWESFWSSTSRYKNDCLSNAQRVVDAMEKLGPTYVKFGQALASRPDIIPKYLAESLCALQDKMEAFDTATAKDIIEKELRAANVEEVRIAILLDSLSSEPVAAASVGQVYKGYLLDVGEVAVKVQRPGIREIVEKDAALLKGLASFVETIPSPNLKGRLVNTQVKAAVDEFMSRIFEELDYTNEASNAKKFAGLYSNKYGSARKSLPGKGVVVPEIMSDYCTENVLVMEWISGRKLTSLGDDTVNVESSSKRTNNNNDASRREYLREKKENLALVEQALYVTLSQLLEHGCMHADPHGGNLLKVIPQTSSSGIPKAKDTKATLAYLDFGLLATIPQQVRDGLVCAVSQLVFAKDVEAVASLFGELDLMPQEILNDPVERAALTSALSKTLQEVLIYPRNENIQSRQNPSAEMTEIPMLKFDKLLDGLVRLVPRFQFQLPPYFINNARALGTLEGIARSLDPNFNAFSLMYPYALNRILQNPTGSPVVDATLQNMVRCKETGKIDREKIRRLLRDSALFTGFSKRRVLRDILRTKSGKQLAKEIVKQEMFGHYRRVRRLLGLLNNELCNLLRL